MGAPVVEIVHRILSVGYIREQMQHQDQWTSKDEALDIRLLAHSTYSINVTK